MSGLRQSIQQELAREPIERGEAPIAGGPGPNRSWRWQSPKARLQ